MLEEFFNDTHKPEILSKPHPELLAATGAVIKSGKIGTTTKLSESKHARSLSADNFSSDPNLPTTDHAQPE